MPTDNNQVTLYTPVHLPSDAELQVLKDVLQASQARWFEQLVRWIDEPIGSFGQTHVHLPWPASLLSREGQVTFFSATRLYRSGWFTLLRMNQTGLEVGLPMTLPLTLGSAAIPEGLDDNLYLKAFVRLLEVNQRQLLECASGGFEQALSPAAEVLYIGRDVPVDLAEALFRCGIVSCYAPDVGRAHYGDAMGPVEGAAVTLVIQDAALAHKLVETIKRVTLKSIHA